jgi:hypothetical protein
MINLPNLLKNNHASLNLMDLFRWLMHEWFKYNLILLCIYQNIIIIKLKIYYFYYIIHIYNYYQIIFFL